VAARGTRPDLSVASDHLDRAISARGRCGRDGPNGRDLPALQSTKFQFVINLKTVKALGFSISDNVLTLADEVIE
jgi:hypothetical protein